MPASKEPSKKPTKKATTKKNKKRTGKRGRPTKITPEVLEECEKLIKANLSIKRIADYIGVNQSTLARSPTFCVMYKKGTAELGLMARHSLAAKAENGDITACIYLDKIINRTNTWKEEQDIEMKKKELKIKEKQLKIEDGQVDPVFHIHMAKDAEPKG